MNHRTCWQATAALVLVALLGFVAVGQNPPPAAPTQPASGQPVPSRDNFSPKGSLLPRLSPEALEKAIKEDFDAESAGGQKELAPRPAVAAKGGVPEHRLSRDVMLSQPEAAAATHKGAKLWQITLKNCCLSRGVATPARLQNGT